MQCPVCSSVRLTMSERQGVEIDYCPQCRGVWLDRGELDKLIERAQGAGMQPVAAAATVRHHEQRGRYENEQWGRSEVSHDTRHRKKKSFLSDMFDFD